MPAAEVKLISKKSVFSKNRPTGYGSMFFLERILLAGLSPLGCIAHDVNKDEIAVLKGEKARP